MTGRRSGNWGSPSLQIGPRPPSTPLPEMPDYKLLVPDYLPRTIMAQAGEWAIYINGQSSNATTNQSFYTTCSTSHPNMSPLYALRLSICGRPTASGPISLPPRRSDRRISSSDIELARREEELGKLRQEPGRLEEQQQEIRKTIEEARLAGGRVIDSNLRIRRAYRTSYHELVVTENEKFDEASQEARKSLECVKEQCERIEDLTRQLIDRLNALSDLIF